MINIKAWIDAMNYELFNVLMHLKIKKHNNINMNEENKKNK